MEGPVELDEFVSETLGQILSGIAKAQGTDIGKNVNGAFPGVLGSNLAALPEFGVFARVDFDVAVTAETSVAAKDLSEFGGSAPVVFAVPLRLPDGGSVEANRG